MKPLRISPLHVAASISLLTVLIYLPALHDSYVSWDDPLYVFENPHILAIDGAFVRWALLDFHAAYWAPLTWLSYALDHVIWGLDPGGYHLTNIILHAANCFVVTILAAKVIALGSARRAAASGAPRDGAALIAATITGLLFSLHPLRVESVVWIAERKGVLSGLFFLLSIVAYLGHASVTRQEGSAQDPRRGSFGRHYILAFTLFVLALCSKPTSVSLPAVLLLLDWYPLGRLRTSASLRAALLEKIPFFAASLASVFVSVLAARAAAPMIGLDVLPLSTRVLVAARSLVVYVGKTVWPANLVPFYPYPQDVSLRAPEYLLPLVLVLGITVAAIAAARRRALWLTAWSYYVVTLLPVIGLTQAGAQARADRFTYLPSLAPFLLIGLGVAWIWRKAEVAGNGGTSLKIGIGAAVVCALGALSYRTVNQIEVWADDLSLWSYIVDHEPTAYFAYSNRAMVYMKRGDVDGALRDLDAAIALNQDDDVVFVNRGMLYLRVGQVDRAAADLERACALGNDFGCKMTQMYRRGERQ